MWGKSEGNAFLMACDDFQRNNGAFTVSPLVEDTMFSSKQTITALQKISSIEK